MLADERFELVIDDGMNYVAEDRIAFDVIIVDSTDPLGPGKVLFSHEFYAACRRCMKKGAVMVTQNGVPILQADELTSGIGKFRRLFADGYCYVAAIPTYVGGHMAMGWATDNAEIATSLGHDHRRAATEGRQLRDQVLDARSARRGFRAAALHSRTRWRRRKAGDPCHAARPARDAA